MNFFLRILSPLVFLVSLATGCQLISNTPSSENRLGVIAGVPTAIAPEKPIFRDDFNGQLNPAWTRQNEDASRYKINEDGWLEITGGDESILSGEQQTNLLWAKLPRGDFVILVHLKSQPLFDYQKAGLLLFGDSEHYISLNRGYCMECVLGGSGVFLEYNLNGRRGRYSAATDATDLYLMLIRAHGVIGAFYSLEAGQWKNIANLEDDIPFERAGLSVTNDSRWEEGYDVIGEFDFFEIRSSFHQTPMPLPIFLQQRGNF